MTAALVSTAAMSVGAVAVSLGLHPLIALLAFAAGIGAVLVAARREPDVSGPTTRAIVATAAVAVVADRHLFVASSAVAPDDVLAALVVLGAFVVPRGPRWAAIGAAVVLATYVTSAAILIAATRYHSDAVVAAHGAAAAVLAGRDPYASFDLVAQLARFGLPPEFATPLADGTRLRALQYPALTFLVPAPLVAAGLTDLRALYLAEVLAIFALVLLAMPERWRALALAACVGDLVILDQFVLAGIDPLWALLVLGAWLARRSRTSAVLLGLALATRQPAWLIAPFIVAWTGQRLGAREALARGAVAVAVALAIHLPFLAADAAAVVEGITAPALLPLEPWGIGPAKTLADTVGPVVPRALFVVASAAAYALALWTFARRPERGALVLPLAPLWISWRALQSYFAFLPLFLLSDLAQGEAPRSARVLDLGAEAPWSARPRDGVG